MKEYRKTATVMAKIFEPGDEDGIADSMATEDFKMPYISTLENQMFFGRFGENYVCTGIKGERWLVEKEIFESTYEPVVKTLDELAKEIGTIPLGQIVSESRYYVQSIYTIDNVNRRIIFHTEGMPGQELWGLLREYPDYEFVFREEVKTVTTYSYLEKCPCNPANGGSGICGCTMGNLFTTTCKYDG